MERRVPHKKEIDRKEYFRQWLLAGGPAVQRRKEKIAAWRASPEGKEKRREEMRRYYEKNKNRLKTKPKVRSKSPITEQERDRLHFKKYGITLAERQKMLDNQGNKCGCCGSSDPQWVRGWHLDHCHKTKKVRSLLCKPCNTTLGVVGDDIGRLQKMIDYLQGHK